MLMNLKDDVSTKATQFYESLNQVHLPILIPQKEHSEFNSGSG